MMNILSESLIRRSLVLIPSDRITELRLAAAWSARLSRPATFEELLASVAHSTLSSPACMEAKTMGGFTDQQMQDYQRQAQRAITYLDFFGDLDYGRRHRL